MGSSKADNIIVDTSTSTSGTSTNYTYAYPVLKKHSIPFAIYITTGYLDGKAVFWWYLLEDLVSKNNLVTFDMQRKIFRFKCGTEPEKIDTYAKIRSTLICSDEIQFPKRLKAIFEPYGIDLLKQTEELVLSWDKVKELIKDPLVTIGAHTVNHLSLNSLSKSAIEYEVLESKKIIENHIDKNVEHFSYPFGSKNEVEEREFELVKQFGFKTATTTRAANVFYEHLNHMEALPRLDLGEGMTTQKLNFITSGFMHCVQNRFKRVVTA